MENFRFMGYISKIMDEVDLDKYCDFIENYLQQQQNAYVEFVKSAKKHIKYIQHCEKSNNYCITCETYDDCGKFYIYICKVYGDKSVKHKEYAFDTEQDRADKLEELRKEYDVEWNSVKK